LNILPKRHFILLLVQIFNRLNTWGYVVFTFGLPSATIFDAGFDDFDKAE
jgi:hypothetical protein